MIKVSGQNMQNKKIIIYGAGQVFEQYKEDLNWNNIVAIVDMDSNKQEKKIHGIKIETPEIIGELQYDYVAVFTDRYFESAKVNLIGNFFVPESKIVSWRIYIDDWDEYEIVSDEVAEFYQGYLEEHKAETVLDVGKQKLGRYFFHNDFFQFRSSNLCKAKFQFHNNFYESIYSLHEDKKYDSVFLWGDYETDISWDHLMKIAPERVIWTIHYSYLTCENYIKNMKQLEDWGTRQTFRFSSVIVYVFEKSLHKEEIDCEIFVVMHKKYNALSNNLYKPICVGNYFDIKFISERTGDNIAYLNGQINECSALYWIWKNTDSEYVGLNHYRRCFYNNKVKNSANYLAENKILKILDNKFDIILPMLTRLPTAVIENVKGAVGERLCGEGYHIIYDILEKKYPNDVEIFDYVMSGNAFYRCNIFVTRRKILNAYCEWLFSFLIEAAELLDVSAYDAQHKRVMGYFAETLLTVWILKQNIRIKELPITDI